MGNDHFHIVGVAPQGLIGTESGAVPDVLVPAMMTVGSRGSLSY